MRKILSIGLIILFLINIIYGVNANIVTNTDENINCVSVTYKFKPPTTQQIRIDDNDYVRVITDDCTSFGDPGQPSLPAKGAYILLPQKTQVKNIQVTGEKIKVPGEFLIEPCAQPVPISQASSASVPTCDSQIYGSSDLFPGKTYDIVGVQNFRGYSILILRLYPVQYVPASGELFYYRDLAVSVETIAGSQVNPLFRGLAKDKSEVLAKVDNPGIIDTYTDMSHLKLRGASESYDLLVITTDQLKNSFNQLIAKHNERGISSMIKTVENIYSEYSGVDNHEKIRNFIIDAYNNYGIEYVLLAGDHEGIPARSIVLIIEVGKDDVKVESWVPSDMYYACLDGTYNYDGDYKWGEYTDGENGGHPDIFPEVYIGRACVDNNADVSRFVVKTLQYINIISNDSYLKKVLLAGEYCGFGGEGNWGGNTLDELINQCSKYGYTTTGIPTKKFRIDTLYDRNWPNGNINGWPAEVLFLRINQNVHIINHVGHGDAWSVMKIYSILGFLYNINLLKNDKPFFVYSVACSAGEFDDYECIGEYLTFKARDSINKYSGAFAGLFNTKYGIAWSDSTDGPSPRLLREFWDAVYGENIKVISKANQDSKEDNLYLIDVSNDVDYMRYVFYSLNLFGDPTISFIQPKTKDVSKDRPIDHNPILARLLKFCDINPFFHFLKEM